MAHEFTYEFEEIEIEKDGVTYVCYGVCNVEYEIVSEMHYNGNRFNWADVLGYDRFKIRITDVDGKDLEYLDCDSDHPYAKLVIAQFDEDFIVELCTKNYEG
jgi:hypothetical protein